MSMSNPRFRIARATANTMDESSGALFRLLMAAVLALLSMGAIARPTNYSSAAPVHYTKAVKVKDGLLRGRVMATGVDAFLGVSYARPPVGHLRWRAPQPARRWHGVREATDYAPSCMQKRGTRLPWTPVFVAQGPVSEDCLYLNVWTPTISQAAHLPVIVFIPGGAFVVGSGSVPVYNGARLAERGAVIVTINYRLGVFGYLALPALREQSSHHSTGNYGMLDQIAALRWVKQNIARFGGNPDNVTVWGQSAGAMSVGVLLASPLAKGLFERAVADSALNASREIVLSYAKAAQTGLKYMHSHGATSVAELRKVSAQELLKGQSIGQFGPVVDGWALKSSAERVDMYGGGVDVPVITGNQANDWRLFAPHVETLADYRKYIRSLYGRRAEDFERIYPAADVAQAIAALQNSSRDRDRVSMYLWASTRAEHYQSPVYTYFFTRPIPWPKHPGFGAFHTGELPYMFDNLSLLDRPWSSSDRSLARLMGTFLTDFARAGRLSSWQPAKKGEYVTNELGGALSPVAISLIGGPDSKWATKLDFWRSVFATPMGVKMPPF